jgi:hypothetical protein
MDVWTNTHNMPTSLGKAYRKQRRRRFLKGAALLGVGGLLGHRFGGRAVSAFKKTKLFGRASNAWGNFGKTAHGSQILSGASGLRSGAKGIWSGIKTAFKAL